LEGQYSIGSETILDPAPSEKKDRVYLWLTGESAQAIYDAMPGRPRKTACEPRAREKTAGGLTCFKPAKGEVVCSVAITLDRGRTAAGMVC
jgi:hypothetical protein